MVRCVTACCAAAAASSSVFCCVTVAVLPRQLLELGPSFRNRNTVYRDVTILIIRTSTIIFRNLADKVAIPLSSGATIFQSGDELTLSCLSCSQHFSVDNGNFVKNCE